MTQAPFYVEDTDLLEENKTENVYDYSYQDDVEVDYPEYDDVPSSF